MSERHPRNYIYQPPHELHSSLLSHRILYKIPATLDITKIEKTVYHLIYSQIMKYQGYVHRINGMPDHIHILASFPPKYPPLRSDKNHQTGNIKKHQIIWNNPIMERMGRRICKLFMQLSGGRNNKKLHHKSEKHHSTIGFADEYKAWLTENGIHDYIPYM